MIDSIRIRGGKPLKGSVSVRGAKNSLPKNMVAALLTNEKCVLHNVSNIEDVGIVSDMIRMLGGTVNEEEGTLEIQCANLKSIEANKLDEFAGKSRIPVLFCGPMLARYGEFEMPALGGCQIGPRPINYHLDALRKFGAKVTKKPGFIKLTANKLKGCRIKLEYPSVGATEQVLLTGVLAEGVTELHNAAVEPEIIDLVELLQKMGAIISVDTNRIIKITGVNTLRGYEHTAMPDRLEVASWACAAAATGGEIFVSGARQQDIITFLNKYRQIGGDFEVSDQGISFKRLSGNLRAITLETEVHPGFMTDWQQPFVVLLTQAQGVSIVHETVYENRFGYVDVLNKMGANIKLHRKCLGGGNCRFGRKNYFHSAVITGPTKLHGANITVPDLRGGFSYVIATLCAEGVSEIKNIQVIYRGYENFVPKLRGLGVDLIEG